MAENSVQGLPRVQRKYFLATNCLISGFFVYLFFGLFVFLFYFVLVLKKKKPNCQLHFSMNFSKQPPFCKSHQDLRAHPGGQALTTGQCLLLNRHWREVNSPCSALQAHPACAMYWGGMGLPMGRCSTHSLVPQVTLHTGLPVPDFYSSRASIA